MLRNAIEMLERTAELADRVKSARYSDRQVINSLNEATEKIVTKRIAPIKGNERYSVQSVQRVRDELYTLVENHSGALTSDVVLYADLVIAGKGAYKYYLLLFVDVNGTDVLCRPTNYNQEGDLMLDPFAKPDDENIYYNDSATGIRVLHGSTALGNYNFFYIKQPLAVAVGQERDKLVTSATLVNTTEYVAYDESVYGGVTYYPGEVITGDGSTLTSGTVIIKSKVIDSDLPASLQDEVVNLGAAILSGSVEDYQKKQALDFGIDKY